MTKTGKSAAPVQRADWWPDRLSNRTKIPPRYVKVPSDQQKLLDRPDAWSAGGFANVPPKVLEDATAYHTRESRLGTGVEREAPSSQPGSPSQPSRAALSSQAPSPVHGGKEVLSSQPASPTRSIAADREPTRVLPEAEGDSDGEENDSGTPIPWTPSPSRHFRSPCRSGDQAGSPRSPSRHPPEQQSVLPSRKDAVRPAPFTDFPPSSSLASETGLEVEVPRAITDVLKPTDRKPMAAMGPTPPSAQVIPCTIAEKTSPVQVPVEKRRRRMKHPNNITAFANLGTVDRRDAPRPTLLGPGAGPSSPVVRSSSPVSRTSPRQLPERFPVVPSTAVEHNPAPTQQPRIVATTSQQASNQGSSNSVEKLPPNGPASQVPFTAFRLAYPDYQGSLNDFIRGVMCILRLQEDKALSEFLYDDFVRVFSGEYLAYIGTLGRYERALPALQWYNENVSRPLYVKGVLTKDNVKDVESRYPKEVLAIRQNLETTKPRGRGRPSYQAPSTTKERTQVAALPAIGGQVLPQNGLAIATASTGPVPVARETMLCTDRRPVAAEPQVVARNRTTAGMVTSSIDIPAPSPALQSRAKIGTSSVVDTPASKPVSFRTQIDSSLPDISHTSTPRLTYTKAPAVSAFANMAPSQLSNPDSIPEITLKRKVAPRGSTGSSASGPGAEFKRPKLTKEEKRDLEFRKFLMWKKTQSSAPQGSAAS